MNEAGGGALVKDIAFVIGGQAVVVKGVRRFSAYYLAIAFGKFYPHRASDISLCAFHIGS